MNGAFLCWQLAFRSVQTTSAQMKEHIRRILQIPLNTCLRDAPAAAASPTPPPPPPPPPPLPSGLLSTGRPLPPLPAANRKGAAAAQVEAAVTNYLRQSVDSYDLTKNTEV